MASSAERAFAVAELREMILLELDCPVEIIRAERVCRAWRNMIQGSQKLQQACWYQAQQPVTTTTPTPPADGDLWRLNPTFKKFGFEVRNPSDMVVDSDIREEMDHAVDPLYWGLTDLRENIRQSGSIYNKPLYRKPGSWDTMLATQPPCRWMIVTDFDSDGVFSPSMVYTRDPVNGGLLMGHVMAVVKNHISRRESHPMLPFIEIEFYPVARSELRDEEWRDHVEEIADSTSITAGATYLGGKPFWYSLQRIIYEDHDDNDDKTASSSGGGTKRLRYDVIEHRIPFRTRNWRASP
ncbi:uncharacterized protein TRUGW13939_07423 [Talaromyces rugulosus]|uniref:F-box domain-containing protein n=1 Tax=Talaromyces rugulosus TaxID=121627 RepID=A0A7H8R1P2_TALRU|nr:uncharacterized protein TRUGW13939_07423 [Talaromyces rugulosus]QKX60280.1 hypothetical protein TRUGW13939_07423 [Talaromyces rugulosus]